jgi:hypothetical protein
MSDVIPRTIMAAINLPPPPGTPDRSDGVNAFVVIAIVVVVLGGVVLIAWLLKPLVARRLAETDAVEIASEVDEAEPATVPGDEKWADARADLEDASEAHEAGQTPETTPVEIVVSEIRVEVANEIGVDVEPIDIDPIAPPAEQVVEQLADGEPDIGEAHGQAVDADEIVGITLTVRELIDFANAGQLLRGFALYTEPFLRRFRAETGLSEDEFEATFGAVPAPPPEAQAKLAAITDVETLPDGRVSALVTFGNGDSPPAPERFFFVRVDGDRWLIDDIGTAV